MSNEQQPPTTAGKPYRVMCTRNGDVAYTAEMSPQEFQDWLQYQREWTEPH